MRPLLVRLLADERGQDIIEYVLLTATIGVSAIAVWPLIEASIALTYSTLDTDTQNLWVPPDPGGGS